MVEFNSSKTKIKENLLPLNLLLIHKTFEEGQYPFVLPVFTVRIELSNL